MYGKRVILLSASPYSMTSEETGELLEGVTLRYISNDNLNPVQEAGVFGIMPAKASVDLSLMEKITIAPAFYDFEFDIKVNARGQVVLKVVDIKFAGAVAVSPRTMEQNLNAQEKEGKK